MSTAVTHLVQYSTGAGSAEDALRCVETGEPVVLMTADTMVEDADNWRFAFAVWEYIGKPEWIYVADGRTPMQVGADEGIVPNDRMAVCSRQLKRELLRAVIDESYSPDDVMIHEGYDWTETHRYEAAAPHWAPYKLAPPVMDGKTKPQILDAWRARGIEPPRLYAQGGSHANCGGACVRGGQASWRRLYYSNPSLYRAWETDEQTIRAQNGGDFAMLRERNKAHDGPLTLRTLRERLESSPSLFDREDEGACGCTLPSDPVTTRHKDRVAYRMARIGEAGAPTLGELMGREYQPVVIRLSSPT